MKNLVGMISMLGIGMILLIPGAPPMAAQKTAPSQGLTYDPATETTVSGTIQQVQHQSNGRWSGTHLILNTDQGALDVHVGPDWFLNQQKITFASGDQVQVKGAKSVVNGSQVLIAREINKNGQSLVLRNPQGFPLWSGGRRRGMQQGMMNPSMNMNCPCMQNGQNSQSRGGMMEMGSTPAAPMNCPCMKNGQSTQ